MAAKKDFGAMERGRPASRSASAARDALRSRMSHPTRLGVDDVQPNPQNPRYSQQDVDVAELADSMKRVGQLQPALIVSVEEYLRVFPAQRDRLGPAPWVVIVGNRRLAAAALAGIPQFDVRVLEDLSTEEHYEDRILIENIQRQDLPPLLEAEQLQRRLNRPGQSLRTVGEAIGKSHVYVAQRIGLLKLIPEFQAAVRDGSINIKVGRHLGTLSEEDQRSRLAAGPPYDGLPAPGGNPVNTGAAHAKSFDDSLATVNPVNTAAAAERPDDQPSADATATAEAVGPVPLATSDEQPVADSPPAAEQAAAQVEPSGDRTLDGPSRTAPAVTKRSLEATRVDVTNYIEAALSALDNAIPDGGDGSIGHQLAEGRRHLRAAREAIIA